LPLCHLVTALQPDTLVNDVQNFSACFAENESPLGRQTLERGSSVEAENHTKDLNTLGRMQTVFMFIQVVRKLTTVL